MLRGYLNAWFPIIAARWDDTGATYVDAFAGPGEYTDAAEGSPIIALRAAARPEVAQYRTKFKMLFFEKRNDRLEHLDDLIDAKQLRRSNVDVALINGDCQATLLPTLDRAGAWDGPMFVNLDGWGVDTHYAVIERIGKGVSTEVLITFEAQWFSRFASLEEQKAGDRVFGETAWRQVADVANPAGKKGFLVDRYLGRLHEAGFTHTLAFEMLDEGGNALFLVFGTNHDLGLEKMKDAMWSIDMVAGQRFRDPRDINQLTFDIDTTADLTLLKAQILTKLESGPATLEELKRYALLDTMFKKAHVDPAVNQLEQAGKVDRSRARKHVDVVVRLRAEMSLF
jgi:three-Cys-motif partner protein